MKQLTDLQKTIIWRFIRGGIASSVSVMILVTPLNITSWKSLGFWISALAMAGIVGFTAGILQAVDKYFRG